VSEDARRRPGRLQSPDSPAARTPAAEHEDALSPTTALDKSVNFGGSQRVGSSPPVANPLVSFPERRDDPAAQ
jgi:hypothetical protein